MVQTVSWSIADMTADLFGISALIQHWIVEYWITCLPKHLSILSFIVFAYAFFWFLTFILDNLFIGPSLAGHRQYSFSRSGSVLNKVCFTSYSTLCMYEFKCRWIERKFLHLKTNKWIQYIMQKQLSCFCVWTVEFWFCVRTVEFWFVWTSVVNVQSMYISQINFYIKKYFLKLVVFFSFFDILIKNSKRRRK